MGLSLASTRVPSMRFIMAIFMAPPAAISLSLALTFSLLDLLAAAQKH
jgi:hypothetical protein